MTNISQILEKTGLSRDNVTSAEYLLNQGAATFKRINSPEDTRFAATIVITATSEEHNGICWVLMDRFNYPNSTPMSPRAEVSGLNKRSLTNYGIAHNHPQNEKDCKRGCKFAVEDGQVSVAYAFDPSGWGEWIEFRFIFA